VPPPTIVSCASFSGSSQPVYCFQSGRLPKAGRDGGGEVEALAKGAVSISPRGAIGLAVRQIEISGSSQRRENASYMPHLPRRSDSTRQYLADLAPMHQRCSGVDNVSSTGARLHQDDAIEFRSMRSV